MKSFLTYEIFIEDIVLSSSTQQSDEGVDETEYDDSYQFVICPQYQIGFILITGIFHVLSFKLILGIRSLNYGKIV